MTAAGARWPRFRRFPWFGALVTFGLAGFITACGGQVVDPLVDAETAADAPVPPVPPVSPDRELAEPLDASRDVQTAPHADAELHDARPDLVSDAALDLVAEADAALDMVAEADAALDLVAEADAALDLVAEADAALDLVALPPSPISVLPQAPGELTPTLLIRGAASFVGPLGGQDFAAVVEGNLHLLSADTLSNLGEVAGVLSVTRAPDGTTLLATPSGLLSAQEQVLGLPPLADALGARHVTDLETVGDVVFLATTEGLLAWRGGALFEVDFGLQADLGEADGPLLIAAGARRLFVAQHQQLFSLSEGGGSFLSSPISTPGWRFETLGVDGLGTLWVIDAGTLRSLSGEGQEQWLSLPEPVVSIAARPDVPEVWIRTTTGLWLQRGGLFQRYLGAGEVVAQAVTALGQVMLARADGLFLGLPGRGVSLNRPDGVVSQPTAAEILPAFPDHVSEVVSRFDDLEARVIAGPPWSILLDPVSLGDGPHSLTVTVRYDDAPPSEVRFDFVVALPPSPPSPTFTEDIAPLFQAHCDPCHGPRGFAHPIAGYLGFRNEIDAILTAVGERRMPLPPNRPLSPEQITLLVEWSAGGAPE